MKKSYILSTLFVFLSLFGYAQSYQCLQDGPARYFVNSDGYLRGMRIDSIRVSGDTTVYYPFHTPRGFYNTTTFYPRTDSTVSGLMDTTGGSWLGKRISQLPDGTTVFDNEWKFSTTIKTQTTIGSTWLFYRDTAGLSYQAIVTSTDTVTVMGSLDSEKTVTIYAYNGTAPAPSDPLNGFQIILSKNHGFLRVFDLYTFPYHLPGGIYIYGLDYYLDVVVNNTFDFTKCTFTQIPFISPRTSSLYQWDSGDIYNFSICNNCQLSSIYPFFVPNQYELDTVTAKDSIMGGEQCTASADQANEHLTPSPGYTDTFFSQVFIYNDTALLIDTTHMPEEYKDTSLYFYLPADTSYCMSGAFYEIIGSAMVGDFCFVNNFGLPPYPIYAYKQSLGMVNYFNEDDLLSLIDQRLLLYYSRAAQGCGTVQMSFPLGVQNVAMPATDVIIFPNPVDDVINIESGNAITSVAISDIDGRILFSEDYNNNDTQIRIAVGDLAPGVYLLKVNDSIIRKMVKK